MPVSVRPERIDDARLSAEKVSDGAQPKKIVVTAATAAVASSALGFRCTP